MKVIEWKDEYSVGDPLMDAHHQQFLNVVHELDQAVSSGKQVDNRAVLTFLVEYASMHFRAEERLMERIGFPETKEHAVAHQDFKDKILEIERSYKKDDSSLTLEELFDVAQEWLITHILSEDKKYQPYV